MSDQLSMFDDEPGDGGAPSHRKPVATRLRPARHDLFFALRPAAGDAAAIARSGARIVRELGVGGELLEAERLHVSLFALATYDEVFPELLVAAASAGASRVRHAAFEVVFDRAASFGKGDTLVLKSATADATPELHGLWRALGIELADAGFPITDRKMTPHMTLAYKCRVVPETPVAPIRWIARDLVLIDSHVGKHRHDVLGHWTLRA